VFYKNGARNGVKEHVNEITRAQIIAKKDMVMSSSNMNAKASFQNPNLSLLVR
jgi:hypothetical protein